MALQIHLSNSRFAAHFSLRSWLPNMLSTPRFTRFALDVAGCTVAARMSVGDITLDASRVACHAGQLCAFPWRFGHLAGA
ncbi:hypothetical protein IG631_10022 [Alternaria alternata]|nr:hypothetical protein IG631_10022 [Alternaria alternata]